MDPTLWGYGQQQPPAVEDDDSNYDNHPELSGYQTLPEQDSKEDHDHDITPVSTPITATAAEAHGFARTMATSGTSQHNRSQSESSGISAPDPTNTSSTLEHTSAAGSFAGSSQGTIEGMKPSARSILQGEHLLLNTDGVTLFVRMMDDCRKWR